MDNQYVRQKVGQALQAMVTNKSLKERLESARWILMTINTPGHLATCSVSTQELIAKFMEDKPRIPKKVRSYRFVELVIGVFREH